jgi:uncharacterized protein (TIGR03435 family)
MTPVRPAVIRELLGGAIVLLMMGGQSLMAQSSPIPAPIASPDKLEFEVASVKPNKTGDPAGRTNVPLGPGTLFTPTGGRFSVVNYNLYAFIGFAYKLTGDQDQALQSQLPAWVFSDHFDIEARAAGNPSKDELRLMVRSLLADRFKLVIRSETRQAPIFALLLSKPGKTGPRLRPHPDDSSCKPAAPTAPITQIDLNGDGFPVICGGLVPMPHGAGRLYKFGARNVTMQFIANQLSIMGQLSRHVQDQTGLTGMFDFALEWSPELTAAQGANPDTENQPGPTFLEALGDQLGVKLVSQKGPVDVLVVDHIEHPSGN